jgi:hypothetical protein
MPHTSVILRCPEAMYAWFEAQLPPGGTVEQAMLAVLTDWYVMACASRENAARAAALADSRQAQAPPESVPVPTRAPQPRHRQPARRRR